MFRSSVLMKVKKARYDLDIGASKFFGGCDIPASWIDSDVIDLDEAFICQINLDEVSGFDTADELPDTGMLYFFISGSYPYAAHVIYCENTEDLQRFDINAQNEEFLDFFIPDEQSIYFEPMNEKTVEGTDCSGVDGIKLLGFPSSLSTMFLPDGTTLLMQFDPLASDMGFLDNIDGYLYFTIEKSALKEEEFDDVDLIIEAS